MTSGRKVGVIWYLVIMGLVWVVMLYLDWSRLCTGVIEEILLSRVLKVLLSMLAGMLVWFRGTNAVSDRDRTLLSLVFGVIVTADVAFQLGVPVVGIGLFTLAHLILIVRNSAGCTALPRHTAWKRYRRILIMVMVGLGAACGAIILFVFAPHAQNTILPQLFAAYSVVLIGSLLAAVIAVMVQSFPAWNARCIIGGVVIFTVGDILVGFNLTLPHERLYVITTSLTWFFYLPALVLLGLSGYWGDEKSGRVV